MGVDCKPPLHQLRDLGSAVSSPSSANRFFFYNFWPPTDHWWLQFLPRISCVYGKVWGQLLALASQSQIWVKRPASPRSPSKYEYNSYTQFFYNRPIQKWKVVVVEQSFTVILHGKAALWPFKLTSENEFFLPDNTFNFSRGGQVPPLAHGCGRPYLCGCEMF